MKKLFLIISGLCAINAAQAAWQLQNPELDFISTKITTEQNSVSEIGTFADVSGDLDDDGKLNITINPLSLRTGIEIRDERINNWVFKTPDFPHIALSSQIDLTPLKALKAGEVLTFAADLTVTIRDHSEKLPAEVIAVRDDAEGFFVTLRQPVLLNASAFALDDGIDQLTTVAKLGAITKQIPVFFNGHFVSE